jgi:hypothetical protein
MCQQQQALWLSYGIAQEAYSSNHGLRTFFIFSLQQPKKIIQWTA